MGYKEVPDTAERLSLSFSLSPGHLPDPGIKLECPTLASEFFIAEPLRLHAV